ncbi:hypothetical protein QFZ53_000447 [Microbacterium natoriense]|uniref:Uncharacterized protein n=1 Tax=Microbacterium natoriense TaxID=284570 RepID=A0AAW8ESG9_9MICO|nr:hypothetical protein [Microbacterium natoriense]MDQ0646251.1 hypothetical protein [Microbacterium natoriense]
MERTDEQLIGQLAELRHANAQLMRALEQERAKTPDARSQEQDAPRESRRRGWGWTLLSTTLIVIGALLSPVAIVSTWAHDELTNTAYFVDTFAPLAKDPAVQDFITDETVVAIESQLDIDRIADDLFRGLDDLNLGSRAQDALGLLKAPAVSGVKGLINTAVTDFVRSDAFAAIWEDALAITHTQLVSTATGQGDAAITVGRNQEISLQLGPIIQAVKEELVADGFALGDRVPAIDRTIVIAESSSIGIYLAIYQIVIAAGIWLPWVSLLLLAAGVLVARRRALAQVWASSALLLSMVLVGGGIGIGENIFAVAVSSTLPHAAATVLYEHVLGFVTHMIVVVGVLAATALAVTLFAGPWRWARTLRAHGAALFAAIRLTAEQRGLSTGRTGERIYRWRVILRIIVGAASAAFLLANRPATPGMIVWTAICAIAVIALVELVSRPPQDAATGSSGDLIREG